MKMIDKRKRQESAFYQNDKSPENVWDGNDRFYVDRCGEMLIIYTDPKGEVHYIRTTQDLADHGITDDKALAEYTAKGEEIFCWRNNSWYEIWDEQKGEYLDEVLHELDEAVDRAIHLYQMSIGEEH